MFKFWKKEIKTDDLAQLSEEDIQKKLYGTYKPGTLGKVIKVDEEVKGLDEEEGHGDEIEPDLFSDINSLGKLQGEIKADIEEDTSEEITTEVEDLAVGAGLEDSVSSLKNDESQPILEDDDLLQIDFNKEEDTFLEPTDHLASIKVTLEEIWDKLRGIGVKYFIISGGILIGVILGFNIISSYVRDNDSGKVVVVNEKREISPSVKASVVPPTSKITSQAPAARDVVTQMVELEGGAITPASTGGVGDETSVEVTDLPAYTVQICVSNKLDATEKLVDDLRGAGLDSFYRRHTTRRGRELFFVYVGQFKNKEDANVAMKHYRTVDQLSKYDDSFVTNLK
ncbi:SPOR domain-containing protein [Candidatus Omnitrophota bacterium]